METVRREPCSCCPYRKDCPSGLWAAEEYEKLIRYDAPTGEQPYGAFSCHATPDFLCHGWAVVHGDELLALRLLSATGTEAIVIPDPSVPLFGSGREAAEHGMRDIEQPSHETMENARRLLRKNPRLET